MDDAALRARMLAVCCEMNRCGLNVGRAGNASLRCGEQMLITPSAADYEQIAPESIPLLDLRAEVPAMPDRPPYPSSEWRMHHAILRSRADADAVLHLHPAHATAVACLRRDIPSFHYMVAVAGGRDIRCCPYATFGSEVLSAHVLAALHDRRACLMANHGLVTLGSSLEDCLALAREVEQLARQYLLALAAGEPVLLGEAEMDAVLAQFARYRRGELQ